MSVLFRSRLVRPGGSAWSILGFGLVLAVLAGPTAARQDGDDPGAGREADDRPAGSTPGQFFTVEQPITSERIERLEAAITNYLRDASARGERPIILLDVQPGGSDFGTSYQLADFIARELGAARKTVAYVPEPLSGFGVLVVLACDEIVIGPEARLGPITKRGEEPMPGVSGPITELARRKGRSEALVLGMLDPSAELLRVRTAGGVGDYVLAEDLEEYRRTHEVIAREPAWGSGARGVLTPERARSEGIAQRLASDRWAVARAYDLRVSADDPTLGADRILPAWVSLHGPIDAGEAAFVKRQVARARGQGANLIIMEFDSPGGRLRPCDDLATWIAGLEDAKTIAYVRDRALGLATLPAMACDEIVFHPDGALGDIEAQYARRGRADPLEERDRAVVADRLSDLAQRNGRSTATARAMVLADLELVEALDREVGAVVVIERERARAEPERYAERGTLESDSERVLTVTADLAPRFGLNALVVEDDEQLKRLYNVGENLIRVDGPTWVDSLVDFLNQPVVGGLLLFLGFLMLGLEIKLPGIGIPAILATLSFLLFFWGRFLGGTADALEVLLFLVGLVCLAMEIFVAPGFGVFGFSGVLLILLSLVMASHTFILPTEQSQFREMGRTLFQLVLSIVAVIVGLAVLGRYLPSLPLFRKLILTPEPAGPPTDEEATAKPAADPDAPLAFLLGETGRTTTVLRPSGKARFGDLLVDVTADGFFIERDSPVQVVDVHGSRVIVKRV